MSDEIKGINHPEMTPEMAKKILPNGEFPISIDLAFAIGELLRPANYDEIPAGLLRRIGQELNARLDKALRAAQTDGSTSD